MFGNIDLCLRCSIGLSVVIEQWLFLNYKLQKLRHRLGGSCNCREKGFRAKLPPLPKNPAYSPALFNEMSTVILLSDCSVCPRCFSCCTHGNWFPFNVIFFTCVFFSLDFLLNILYLVFDFSVSIFPKERAYVYHPLKSITTSRHEKNTVREYYGST